MILWSTRSRNVISITWLWKVFTKWNEKGFSSWACGNRSAEVEVQVAVLMRSLLIPLSSAFSAIIYLSHLYHKEDLAGVAPTPLAAVLTLRSYTYPCLPSPFLQTERGTMHLLSDEERGPDQSHIGPEGRTMPSYTRTCPRRTQPMTPVRGAPCHHHHHLCKLR